MKPLLPGPYQSGLAWRGRREREREREGEERVSERALYAHINWLIQ